MILFESEASLPGEGCIDPSKTCWTGRLTKQQKDLDGNLGHGILDCLYQPSAEKKWGRTTVCWACVTEVHAHPQWAEDLQHQVWLGSERWVPTTWHQRLRDPTLTQAFCDLSTRCPLLWALVFMWFLCLTPCRPRWQAWWFYVPCADSVWVHGLAAAQRQMDTMMRTAAPQQLLTMLVPAPPVITDNVTQV